MVVREIDGPNSSKAREGYFISLLMSTFYGVLSQFDNYFSFSPICDSSHGS